VPMTPISDDWLKCYGEGWTGIIVPEAFCHPAKFSRSLIRRIYAHAVNEGWVEPGGVVIDPFGGVALGGLEAMRRGLHWIGVELEERFCALAQDNIDLWNNRYAAQMPNWGSAVIVQGDSRRLGEVLGRARICVSSPPFVNCEGTRDKAFMCNHYESIGRNPDGPGAQCGLGGHYQCSANLGNLPDTGFEAALAVSSPPWQGNLAQDGRGAGGLKIVKQLEEKYDRRYTERSFSTGNYSGNEAQLAQMPPGDHAQALEAGAVTGRADLCLSSPPFEQSLTNKSKANDTTSHGMRADGTRRGGSIVTGDYGNTAGQLGQETGSTFWAASREILEQVYEVLAPNAHAIFVCKRFVRNKEIVDFPLQWAQLCEAVGFTWIHHHKAWLVEDRGAQHTLDGGLDVRTVERKSFFRRLAENKGSPRIDYEDVLCFIKEPQ